MIRCVCGIVELFSFQFTRSATDFDPEKLVMGPDRYNIELKPYWNQDWENQKKLEERKASQMTKRERYHHNHWSCALTTFTWLATRGIYPYTDTKWFTHWVRCSEWPCRLLIPVDPISNSLPVWNQKNHTSKDKQCHQTGHDLFAQFYHVKLKAIEQGVWQKTKWKVH